MKERNNDYNIITYCIYCKEPISSEDTYVISDGKHYHIDCFKLLMEDTEF